MGIVQQPIEIRLGERLRRLRRHRGMTLEALAEASGISKSMISLAERGETSPSAGVLDKLAGALGIPTGVLFLHEEQPGCTPVSRASKQPVWRDPDSGYARRTLSPPGTGAQFMLSEVELPPGAVVSYANSERLALVEQQVWVTAGVLVLDAGGQRHSLRAGDCAFMRLDQPTRFANETARPTRYIVATSTLADPRPDEVVDALVSK
jgi:transcriptional regulator with XRE-family HTH domain